MLPEALSELVRGAGADALLLDARNSRALVSNPAQLENICKNLRNAGFTRFIDYTAVNIDGGQGGPPHCEFWMLLTLRHPGHAHAALTLKWKWSEPGRAAASGRHAGDGVDGAEEIAGSDARAPEEPPATIIAGAGQPGGQPLQAGPALHPSLSHIWPAAGLAEREIFEMLGIPFAGHDNLAPLLLDEQFAGFPLRRDFTPPARESYAETLLRQRHEAALLAAVAVGDTAVSIESPAGTQALLEDAGGAP